MIESFLIPKFKVAEEVLATYADLYWYRVDVYEVDEKIVPALTEDYGLYLDLVLHKLKTLPKKTVSVRIVSSDVDVEEQDLGYLLTTGFELGFLDLLLRRNRVSLRIGDIVATHRIVDELAELKSFEQLTKPAFVRIVQSIVPRTVVIGSLNVLEWVVKVSDTDVVFRYYV